MHANHAFSSQRPAGNSFSGPGNVIPQLHGKMDKGSGNKQNKLASEKSVLAPSLRVIAQRRVQGILQCYKGSQAQGCFMMPLNGAI